MCPLWPLHYILLYPLLLGPIWYLMVGVVGSAAQTITEPLNLTFKPDRIQKLKIDKEQSLEVSFHSGAFNWNQNLPWNGSEKSVYFEIDVVDPHVASVQPEKVWLENITTKNVENGTSSFNVTVRGEFIGYSEVCVKPVVVSDGKPVVMEGVDKKCAEVSVIRQPRVVDKVFTYSVAVLVTVMYINMGAALDLQTIRATIRRPYGPAIGVFSQFVIMPLLSYGIAKAFIRHPALQLGLFITGCSPGGGASNVWTLALGGNLDLSVTMTTMSTFAAFAMMPFWIFTLGSTIFNAASLAVPYSKIATFAISLVVPLAIGIGIQLKWPKVAKFLVRILKPFAIFLIVFIVVFAIYTNLFLLQLLTWEIILCGMLLPWLGYFLGGGLAILLRREWEDVIAIAIETGVQNTGLSIFALRFSLAQPEADLTTVLPVAVAIMTPVIPTFMLAIQKLHAKVARTSGFTLADKEDSLTPCVPPSV